MEYRLKTFTRTREELETLENLDITPPGDLLIPLVRNLRHINAALNDYDEAVQKVIRELGQPGPRGWFIPTDDVDSQAAFYRAQREMLETEIEVDIHPLALSRFVKAAQDKPGFQVPLRCLTRLTYLIDLDVDEVPDDLIADDD